VASFRLRDLQTNNEENKLQQPFFRKIMCGLSGSRPFLIRGTITIKKSFTEHLKLGNFYKLRAKASE
jgi:hypothetical protein